MKVAGTTKSRQLTRGQRREMTKPERLLWQALRANKTGFHFRRQHAAGPFVLDFYCDAAGLCIEVDGSSHDFTVAQDEARDRYVSALGIMTLRIAASDVLFNLEGCVQHIATIARTRPLRQR